MSQQLNFDLSGGSITSAKKTISNITINTYRTAVSLTYLLRKDDFNIGRRETESISDEEKLSPTLRSSLHNKFNFGRNYPL